MSTRLLLPGLAAVLLSSVSAHAADLPMRAAPPPVVETCKATISTPAFGPTIKANPNPSCWTSPVGDIYFGGALTGYAYGTTNPFSTAFAPPGTDPDRVRRVDFSNVQGWVQKADGPFQFFAMGGLYSIPSLGLPVYKAIDQNSILFGPVPVAFGKYVIDDNWSIQGGRMFTNIGSELPFTFQNINISRGLLFNQENIINQGAQINYTNGPLNASLAVTDGFYSGELNWVTGLVTYKLDDYSTIGVNGGTHFREFDSTTRGLGFQFATPYAFQNSSIVSVNYTYANGPWTITPYGQYTSSDRDLSTFSGASFPGAETYGGALLVAYSFNDFFSIGGRFEYIAQSGRRGDLTSATSLLYGPGSSAYSFTVTPTFTFGRYFLRAEYSHVEAMDITAGFGFGRNGDKRSQDRYMVETGVTF